MVTLAEELPFAIVARDEQLDNVCSACFTSRQERPISPCTRCGVVYYCNKECRKKDWSNHKQECTFLVNRSPRVPGWMCRLVCRIALKLRRGDEAKKPAFNGRVFADLMDNRGEIEKDAPSVDCAMSLSRKVRRYMGEKFAPSPDLVMSIYGKIITNTSEMGLKNAGVGLYLGLSVHDHSCCPDAFLVFDRAKAVLRSPNKDQKYSKNLTVRYIYVHKLKKERQEQLNNYFFQCTCKVCLDPTMDFMYNSARSTCCTDSYCLLDPDAKELTCFKCGAISGIDVEKALEANEEARIFENLFKRNLIDNPDSHECLVMQVEEYERLSKVLSPFNVNLMAIHSGLLLCAVRLDDYRVCHKYASVHLHAYRQYLPVGDSDRSLQLLQTAVTSGRGAAPSRIILQLYEEALEAAFASHGPKNNVAISMEKKVALYRDHFKGGK